MSALASARRFGTRAVGGLVTCLLLLPLPVLAYTIAPWTFTDNGVSLAETIGTTDHKSLSYGSGSGGSGFSGSGQSTINGSANETVAAHLNMAGLTIIRGFLTVTITIGGVSHSVVVTGPANLQQDFAPFTLAGGNQSISVLFQWSVGAQYVYNATTAVNLQFH
jgi:hypothetical protein